MLTIATLGLFAYGLYSTVWPSACGHPEPRAGDAEVKDQRQFALALGAMLGLQATAVHSAVHLADGLAPQIGRALPAGTLLALARAGSDTSIG